jgi:hypothetical protein
VLLELDNLVRRRITDLYRILGQRRVESQFEYANVCCNDTQVPLALGNRWEMRYRDETLNTTPDLLKQNP